MRGPEFFTQASYAAELVGAVVYLRAMLQRAREHDPSVVSLRVSCDVAEGIFVDVSGQFVNADGSAVAGFSQ